MKIKHLIRILKSFKEDEEVTVETKKNNSGRNP